MNLLKKRISLLLIGVIVVALGIVVFKAVNKPISVHNEITAEGLNEVTGYVLQDPVAMINNVPVAKTDFLDFVEGTQGQRVEVFPSKAVLAGYLDSYALYNTLEERAIEQGLDRSEDAKDGLEVLELMLLANVFDEAELPFTDQELEAQMADLKVMISDTKLLFFARKQRSQLTDQEILAEPEVRGYIQDGYKRILVKADQARLIGAQEKEQYQKQWDWLKKEYLSDLYIQNHLKKVPKTEKDINLAMEQWLSEQDFSEYKVAHIYLDDSEFAQTVLDDIHDGKMTFEEAALTYSLDTNSKKDEGMLNTGQWIMFPDRAHPFAKAVAMLEVGDISSHVVKGISGYHIIRLYDQKEGGIPEYMDLEIVQKNAWEELVLSKLYEVINKDFEIIVY